MPDGDGRSRPAHAWSSELLADVLHHLPEGICVTDAASRVRYVNRAFSRIYGLPDEWDEQSVLALLAGADGVRCGEGREEVWRGQVSHRRFDGRLFTADYMTTVLRDETGRPIGRLHLVTDPSGLEPDATSCAPRPTQAADPVFGGLTVREREVLSLLCDGQSNKELASRLGISVRTAEHHRQAITKKLDVHSMADLIKLAIRHRLIDL